MPIGNMLAHRHVLINDDSVYKFGSPAATSHQNANRRAAVAPSPRSESAGTQGTDSTSWTLTYPATIAAGDAILVFVATDGNPTVSASGFTVLADRANGSTVSGHVLAKVAAGTETGTFALTVSAAEQGTWRIASIKDTDGTLNGIAVSGATTGANESPDPAAFVAPWIDTLYWRTVYVQDNGLGVVSAYPTTHTLDRFSDNSGGAGGASMGTASKNLRAGQDNAEYFTSTRTDPWVAFTLVVRTVLLPSPSLTYLSTDGSTNAPYLDSIP